MNTSYNVFSGAFSEESGQRFLRIMQDACDATFEDLYAHSMPHHPTRYCDCLDRVSSWDASVVKDELSRIKARYPDVQDVFKSVYLAYVKSMRGSKTSKLVISMPKLDQFVHTNFANFSKHRYVRDARYFKTNSVLERRVVCMDALRDSMFQYIGDDNVTVEARAAATVSRGASVVASSIVKEDDVGSVASSARPPSVASDKGRTDIDDAETKVVSSVFEDESRAPPPLARVDDADDSLSSIGPDDSVSCADFAQKQHDQLKIIKRAGRNLMHDAIPEDDQASHTSLSLSSVSITQNGPVPKKTRPPSDVSSTASSSHRNSRAPSKLVPLPPSSAHDDAPFDEDPASEISVKEETVSEASMARANERSSRKKSPPRSYITQLEDSD